MAKHVGFPTLVGKVVVNIFEPYFQELLLGPISLSVRFFPANAGKIGTLSFYQLYIYSLRVPTVDRRWMLKDTFAKDKTLTLTNINHDFRLFP